jgi:hypothetical protein
MNDKQSIKIKDYSAKAQNAKNVKRYEKMVGQQ